MRILLSNDDGVHAPGLKALYLALKRLGKVTVVAPLEERSTTGHSLTLHKPLRMLKLEDGFYGVNGSPADCVYLGIREAMKARPDMVVSGINRGANLGQDIYYSGTVSAAREACMMGIPAFAVSLAIDFHKTHVESKLHYATAGAVLVDIIKELDWKHMPSGTLLNVNVPDLARNRVKGVRLARQGFRHYTGDIIRRQDHRGRPYYWVGGTYKGFREMEGSDCNLVDQGYASITPLRLDCTDDRYLKALAPGWDGAG